MESVKTIYFIGIGGARLNALAKLYADRGYQIAGSDRQESKATRELIERGIKVSYGHSPSDIGDVDLVVYTNAVGEDNPQLMAARERGLRILEGSELLGKLMDEVGYGIAVSGTHGKTTTTSMLSLILTRAGVDPTILIGGDLSAIGGNHRTGKSPYILVEACEFRRSFLELSPKIAIVTNVDWDHPDCFPTPESVVEVFRQFIGRLPQDGLLVINGDDPNFNKVKTATLAQHITFGFGEACDLRAIQVEPCNGELGSKIHLALQDGTVIELTLHVPGRHNVYNALAAIAVAQKLGVEPRRAAEILQEFGGVRKRFEIKGQSGGVLVVDDYAHHPAAVSTTLATARHHFNGRIWCVFQPHLYTRTRYLMEEFAKAFKDCDILILDDIYAAREKDPGDVSSGILAEKVRQNHTDVRYIGGKAAITEHLLKHARSGDLIITMGAGDIVKVGETFLLEKSQAMEVSQS